MVSRKTDAYNRCQTLKALISAAFQRWANRQLNPPHTYSQREGGPSWIASLRYTITAKAEGNVPRGMMSGPMMQALLQDRFGLKIHLETREIPIYALTIGRGGNKMRRVEASQRPVSGSNGGIKLPPSFHIQNTLSTKWLSKQQDSNSSHRNERGPSSLGI